MHKKTRQCACANYDENNVRVQHTPIISYTMTAVLGLQ